MIADYHMDDRFRGECSHPSFYKLSSEVWRKCSRSPQRGVRLSSEFCLTWNVSSVWLESLLVTQVVTCSSHVRSAELYRDGEVGISRVSYARSRVFESHSRYKHIKYVERCHNLWHLFSFYNIRSSFLIVQFIRSKHRK